MYKHSDYLRHALQTECRKTIIELAVQHLEGIDFDCIAFSGMSGALIAPSIADALNKHILIVRKREDSTHSRFKVEGWMPEAFRYIIIDDMISTGDTIGRIIKTVNPKESDEIDLVGIYLYAQNSEQVSSRGWIENTFGNVLNPADDSRIIN